MALDLPGVAEADVGETDGAPDEEVGEAGQGQEPVEDVVLVAGLADEGEEAEEELDDDAEDGAALEVDVGEELGGHAALGEGLHGARGAEGARVGDADDGDGDDDVEDGRQDLDAGELHGDDEGRVLCVGALGVEQVRVVRRHDQADEEDEEDVEEGDAPEDLLGGLRDRLARVRRLGGRQPDELGAAKGEGRHDEDGAEAGKAAVEGARRVPVLGAEIALRAGAAAVDDDGQDDEADAADDLDGAEEELDCERDAARLALCSRARPRKTSYLPSP